jgi:hypothetical protein
MKTTGFLKKLILLATLITSSAVWAQVATLVELKGAAQAIPAVGAPRDLRQGDSINQGETVATKAMTTAVIRFEDGQVVALTQNSRFAITNYTYNKMEPAKSNVLFTLLDGGMRAVTGLIGKAKPDNVTYKAANATIGIRGTDVVFAINGNDLVISVVDGKVKFSMGNQSVDIGKQEGAVVDTSKPNQPIVKLPESALEAALNKLGANSSDLKAAIDRIKKAEDNAKQVEGSAVRIKGGPSITNSGTTTSIGGGRPSGN